MRRILLAVLFASCTVTPAFAQSVRPSPNCALAERRFDNPFSDRAGWTMRRYQWHGFYAGLSTAAAEGIHRATKMPRWASAVTASLAIGFVPHARGLLQHRYRFDWRDVAFDGFTRSAPLVLWTGASGGTWQSRTLAVTTLAGGYLAGACYASP